MTSLDDALDSAWTMLVRGGADRRSALHTPVVTSVTADGLPDARVMVLRKAERAAAMLRFHTDARSPKALALDGGPVTVLGYDAGASVQLRIGGVAHVLTDGEEVDAIWSASTAFARRCYMATHAPGTVLEAAGSGLPADVEGRMPSEDELVPARANFAIVKVHVTAIDWLHLAASGHRRALFRSEDGWRGCWLAP